MATLEFTGFDALDAAYLRISDIPWEVTQEALAAMSEEAAARIRSSGESMNVRDPESGVHILDKIKPSKAKQTETGGVQYVTFTGSRTRNGIKTRNAEIAFINEYGKRGQVARPFMLRAMEDGADEISEKGEAVLGEWTEKEFMRD